MTRPFVRLIVVPTGAPVSIENVSVCSGTSGSVASAVMDSVLPSSTVWLAIGWRTGDKLAGRTVSVNAVLALVIPSETTTLTVVVPDWFVSGDSVNVRLAFVPAKKMFSAGSRFVFDENAVTSKFDAAVSKSDTVKGMDGTGVFSATVRLVIAEMVGVAFTTICAGAEVTTLPDRLVIRAVRK